MCTHRLSSMLSCAGLLSLAPLAALADPPTPGDILKPPGLALGVGACDCSVTPTYIDISYTQQSPGVYRFSNLYADGTVAWLGGNLWRLTLNVLDTSPLCVMEVRFPYDSSTVTLGSDAGDDAIMCPWWLGVAFRSATAPSDFWPPLTYDGWGYPGLQVSPVVIMADGRYARIMAAANWPPKRVLPALRQQRMAVIYVCQKLMPGSQARYDALYATVTASTMPTAAEVAWAKAASLYKAWLLPKLQAENLSPAPYPTWLKNCAGFIEWGAQDSIHPYSYYGVRDAIRPNLDKLPAVLVWGQMADFHWGCIPPPYPDPCNHYCDLPCTPPPAECWPLGYTCCGLDRNLHPRYFDPSWVAPCPAFGIPAGWETPFYPAGGLPAFAAETVSDGYHVGYYSTHQSNYDLLATLPTGETNLDWLLEWIGNHEEWNADIHYVDVLGWDDAGPALDVARVLRDKPQFRDAIMEGMKDLYPVASLMSGCLDRCTYGPVGFCGQDGHTLTKLFSGSANQIMFPPLGSFLLEGRILFSGHANGGHQFWGPGNQNYAERQAFLLGHRFDASVSGPLSTTNPVLELALKEREDVGWYARSPAYQDYSGLSGFPPSDVGIDVRRFVDKDGVTLLAVDNPNQQSGKTVNVLGTPITLPAEKLSIVEVP